MFYCGGNGDKMSKKEIDIMLKKLFPELYLTKKKEIENVYTTYK